MSIYLDHAATTPIDARVVARMADVMASVHGNPSSTHNPGRIARGLVETARDDLAALIAGQSGQIVFTSGATEADNLALFGLMRGAPAEQRHLVTSRIEHRAILDAARQLEAEGVRVTYVDADREGRVPVSAVEAAIGPQTWAVSVMWVNNETGVIQDVMAMAAICRARGVIFHSDAAQALGHLPIRLCDTGIDLASLSAHKMGGPAGVGALWVGARAAPLLKPILFGGGQEHGWRPGTLPLHQIVGLGEASRIAAEQLAQDIAHYQAMTELLAARLSTLPSVQRNGPAELRAPHILNLAFGGVDGEALHASLPGLAISGGSACGAERGEPSYVLRSLGRDDPAAEASIRFSVGRQTTENDIELAAKIVENAVKKLRSLWSD